MVKFKVETSKNNWIDEFTALRSEDFSYEYDGKNTNKLKGISKSQSKSIKFEDYYNCVFGGEYQK